MKKVLSIFFCCIILKVIFLAPVYSSPDPDKGWILVWTDEFDNSLIDKNIWSQEEGYGPNSDGWGVGGLQRYTSDKRNSYVENGVLMIQAIYSGGAYDDRNYTSARLTTKDRYAFQYGKIAARIKAPYGQGIWPALWMLGVNRDKVGWPQCGEIDIMEMFGGGKGKDDTALGTLHFYDKKLKDHVFFGGKKQLEGQKLADDFHIYEIEWDESQIIWRLDGVEYHRESIDAKKHPERKAFHNKFYMILNLDVGASFQKVGYPDAATIFPQTMEVDWVRVYKKQQ